MRFIWDNRKRALNLARHGFDFAEAPRVFEGSTFTFEDDRFDYGEQRFVTFGMLGDIVVSIVHAETARTVRVISFRRATTREQTIYYSQIRD